jgi:hypothetical protein
MKAPFADIRITDLDVDLTQPSEEAPGFRRLYLKLSEEPRPEWVRLFEQVRRFPARRTWRNAWVVGDHIVIESIPDELEKSQLNHLKEDVANANRKFSEWTISNQAQTRRQLREHAESRKHLEELRAKLKF